MQIIFYRKLKYIFLNLRKFYEERFFLRAVQKENIYTFFFFKESKLLSNSDFLKEKIPSPEDAYMRKVRGKTMILTNK